MKMKSKTGILKGYTEEPLSDSLPKTRTMEQHHILLYLKYKTAEQGK